jgi:predicted nucleic acid-binding OB-fold protein
MSRDRELEEREKRVFEELERLKRILKALNVRAKRVFGEGR